MKRHRDITFFAILAAAVIVTIGFTIVYIGRAMHPAVLMREEAYINFDGRQQIITGVYRFKNRLPMNAAIPLEYTFPDSDGLGDAIVDTVLLEVSMMSQVLDFKFADQRMITFELSLPPFDDGLLTVGYRQNVSGNHLGYIIKSAGSWGTAARVGTVYLKLPPGYGIAESNGNWLPAGGTEWDWKMELPKKPDERIDIFIVEPGDS